MSVDKFRKKFWNFSDSHPKFSRNVDKFMEVTDRLTVIFTIFYVTILVGIPSVTFYFMLDENVRNIVSPIISAIFSVIIIPIVLDSINRANAKRIKRFEMNKTIYDEFAEIITKLIKKSNYSTEDVKEINEFITNNYGKMCLSMSSQFIWDAYLICRECKNNNRENVIYYAQKCFKYIRKQCGLKDEFFFSKIILEEIKENDIEKKVKVLHIKKKGGRSICHQR